MKFKFSIFNIFKRKNNKKETSANLFLNIRDIQNNFLYTIDNKVIAYLRYFQEIVS